MPPRPNSRIEVDLKLLEDKNVQRLEEFGKQFDASILRLADTLQREAQNFDNIATSRAGKLSDNASTGAVITSPPARTGGWQGIPGPAGYGYEFTGFGGAGGAGGGGGFASVAPTSGGEGQSATTPGGGISEEQYAKATMRLGENVPVGLRQTLGYAAEGAIKIPGISQEMAKRIHSNLFAGQAVMANLKLAHGTMSNLFASIQAPTTLGQDLGKSRDNGWFGTGLMSSAFKTGFRENWQAMKASDFGFNPNYTTAQAQAARQTTQSMGYSGHMADTINEQMKQLQIHQNIDPGTVMGMLDPMLRYGSFQSGESLIDTLRAIPEAAKAAGFNLKQFTEQLTETSMQVAQQIGASPGQVAGALSSYSAVTGLAPSTASDLFTANNMFMGAAMTGTSLTEMYENPSAAPEMAFGLTRFQQAVGMPMDKLLQLRKTNKGAYDALMAPLYAMYGQNPQIFGGLSPKQLENLFTRNNGRPLQHMKLDQQIRQMNTSGGKAGAGAVNKIEKALADYGPNMGAADKNFKKWREDWLTQEIKKHPHESQKTREQRMREAAQTHALNILGGAQKKGGKKAAVEITLSPEAKKWFDIMTKNSGQADTQDRNAGRSFWRASKGIGKSAGHLTEDIGTDQFQDVPGDLLNVGQGIGSLF